jgi:hypothetical protein
VMLLFPWWTERARLFLPDSLPVVGYLGSDADPLTAYSRVWVLSQPDLPGNDTAGFERAFLPKRSLLGAPRDLGHLRLTLYRNGRHRPLLFSATDAVASAQVYVEGPGGAREPCAFDGTAHRCPGNLHVAVEWHEILFQPRHCLWLAPPGGNRRLVVEFPQVPAGALWALEGGIIWEHAFSRAPQYTAAHFGMEDAATGRPLTEIVLPPGLEGVQRAELAPPSNSAATVRLWSQSERADSRDVCVDFYAWGPEGEGAP